MDTPTSTASSWEHTQGEITLRVALGEQEIIYSAKDPEGQINADSQHYLGSLVRQTLMAFGLDMEERPGSVALQNKELRNGGISPYFNLVREELKQVYQS